MKSKADKETIEENDKVIWVDREDVKHPANLKVNVQMSNEIFFLELSMGNARELAHQITKTLDEMRLDWNERWRR